MNTPRSTYQLSQRGWDHEADRLRALQRWADPQTTRVLDRIGVAAGWRCLEVGAGAGSIARWLANRVGPTGHVLAVDLETDLLTSDPRPNLQVRRLDILTDPLPAATVDLVHARSVLAYLPDPGAAIKRLLAALRPGGWLVLGASDFVWTELPAWPAHPPAAQHTITTVLRATMDFAASWYDRHLGRALIEHLYTQALVDCGGEMHTPLADRDVSQWLRLRAREEIV